MAIYPASRDGYTADELALFAENDEPCYRQAQEIRKNLLRKVKAGNYSKALAPKLWLYWADNASQRYGREVYRIKGHAFSVADRKAAAKEAADRFDADLKRAHGDWRVLAAEYGVGGERGLKARRVGTRKVKAVTARKPGTGRRARMVKSPHMLPGSGEHALVMAGGHPVAELRRFPRSSTWSVYLIAEARSLPRTYTTAAGAARAAKRALGLIK